MKSRFIPTQQHLDEGVVHICYEYANLMSAAHWDINGCAPWRTNVDDAFLLGCRKMADFFLKAGLSLRSGNELPDILAQDYTTKEPTWDLPIWKNEWQGPMDKQLAHLSYVRDKSWDHRVWVPRLEKEFRSAWRKFRAALPVKYKKAFRDELAKCRRKPGFSGIRL